MKKIISVILILSTFFCMSVFADESDRGDFEHTPDGTITAYYGGSYTNIPEQIQNTPIKKIGDKAFFDLGVEGVNIYEGIEEIGVSSFEGSNLMELYAPSTLKSIGKFAFMNCSYLQIVFLNSSDDIEIGEKAFYGTGRIAFYIPCSESYTLMDDKIYAAKGDKNYDLDVIHLNIADGYDDFGASISVCADCGFMEVYNPEGALPFEDVSSESWYAPYVSTAYEYGIINGKSDTVFDPDAPMTLAEAVKIAASIHAYTEGNEIPNVGVNWYDPYVAYCYDNMIIPESMGFEWNRLATRAQMAFVFSHASTDDYYINDVPITDIPDVNESTVFRYEILDLYNKGIAVGTEDMSFNPDANIKRSEVAALISRMLVWSMRIELAKG